MKYLIEKREARGRRRLNRFPSDEHVVNDSVASRASIKLDLIFSIDGYTVCRDRTQHEFPFLWQLATPKYVAQTQGMSLSPLSYNEHAQTSRHRPVDTCALQSTLVCIYMCIQRMHDPSVGKYLYMHVVEYLFIAFKSSAIGEYIFAHARSEIVKISHAWNISVYFMLISESMLLYNFQLLCGNCGGWK